MAGGSHHGPSRARQGRGAVVRAKQAVFKGAEQVQRQTKEALEAADHYVRRSWAAIGVATVTGFVLGRVVGRRWRYFWQTGQ
jgi:ElaB/YqjD/DUF883 family membrane-anchored ribosome-binding protein